MAVTQLLARGALLNPDGVCLLDAQGPRTYRQVVDRVGRIATRLCPEGATDEKCAVLSENAAGAVECLMGVQWGGAVYVPLNPKNTVRENIVICETCEVSTLFFHSSFAAHVREVQKALPAITQLVCIDREVDGLPSLLQWLGDAAPQTRHHMFKPLDVPTLYSTGGTTGKPKAVMITSNSWDIAAANFHAGTPVKNDPVFLAVSPITHAAGTFAFMVMGLGGKTVILPGFDADAILDAIERERVTHLYLPPTAIYMLMEHPGVRDRDFSSLEYFMYTSSPMAKAKIEQALSIFGPVMVQFWGQTEAPSFCTYLAREDHLNLTPEREKRLASCGRPMLLTPVAAMAPDGKLLGPNETGELVVNGPLVMGGYYRDPVQTAAVSAHGWHHTGDVGYVDDDGYVFIVDRMKDMIITGGYNVYAREVEAVILAHPAVQECAVIGRPDEKWGEAVTGVIELKKGASVTTEEFAAYCKQALGSIKAPKCIEFWPELPRTSVGKVDKKSIRATFWQGQARAI